MTLSRNHTFIGLILSLMVGACSPKIAGNQGNGPLDRSQPPAPGPAPEVRVGEYESFTLDNGLNVYVVENHKLPYVSLSLALDVDPIQEGDKAGYVSIMGDMLRRGTQSRSKEDIDEAVDFIGATLATSGTGLYASSLTKHADTLMTLVSDVLLHPTFPEEELEKVRTETLSELVANKADPGAIADNVKTALRYGRDNPYGEIETETTVKNIQRQDLADYYQEHFKPNIAYLAVVGDITKDAAKELVETYLGQWPQGEVPTREFEVPTPPARRQVAIVDKPGAVQSVLSFTYPVKLQMKDDDYLASVVMNSILGGSFGSRLNQNLREGKGYTYGAGSSLAPDERIGYFTAEAQVRNEVTDSAATEFIHELERIRDQDITDEELEKAKQIITGRFARSLEDPQTVARFAINTALYDLPEDFYEKYLQRIAALTLEEVNQAAQKYVTPDQVYLVAVGDESALDEKLASFGEIEHYDIYGVPRAESGSSDVGDMTAEEVIDRYLEAIGGRGELEAVEAVRMKAEATVQGVSVQMDNLTTKDNQLRAEQVTPMGTMTQVYDGEKGYVVMPQGQQELTGPQLDMMREEATLFPQLHYQEDGFALELTGTEAVEESSAYVVKVTYPSGNQQTEYYSQESGLLVKETNGQGSVMYQDYAAQDGLQFPRRIVAETPMGNLEFNVTAYELDPAVEESMFRVE